ncbi:MAG: hypothetical protein CL912_19005 [Deltaproteobacteria bacterium]|jgi:hypothetical protein|uniref:Uncharacterized protein n=1 Tax=Cadophora malorum TaxID=108018 RepID=A0A8H8BTM8_9HELO|nr:hypothetical protein IFR04_003273 [Cadophora malorum]MAD85053.1 hypothetical protein [Deltaproteobacteria bacterium]
MSAEAERNPPQSSSTISSPSSPQSPQFVVPGLHERVPQKDDFKTINVQYSFATISSRLDSFREWPYTTVPPVQLAVSGFYHEPSDENFATLICFSCGAGFGIVGPPVKISNKKLEQFLLERHTEDCLWADMRRNATAFSQHLSNVQGGPLSRSSTDDGSCDSHPSRSREEKQQQKKRKGSLSLGSKDDRNYDNELDLYLLVQIKRARKESDAKEIRVVNVGDCGHGNTTELRVFF